MNRREFISLSTTFTGGILLVPNFIHALSNKYYNEQTANCLVFIQLNGGNDGLNTFVPIDDPLYHQFRPNIGFSKSDVINKSNGMAFHPILKGISQIQQNGDLTIVQNVGYPHNTRSHFRSREIWQTASDSNKYYRNGWLGRYLDVECDDHNPTAGINLDSYDSLSLKGTEPNSLTLNNLDRYKIDDFKNSKKLSTDNPALDFAHAVAHSIENGTEEIEKAMKNSQNNITYPNSALGKNLNSIARLIKGNLNAKVYYTSQNGYDTHSGQLNNHQKSLGVLDEAVLAFYQDLKADGLLKNTTLVIFSEFGRRVQDNGKGTDHGAAAPMFIIGGGNNGKIIGENPDLINLENGDLKYKIDFRSVYASLLNDKLAFNPKNIGIENSSLKGIF